MICSNWLSEKFSPELMNEIFLIVLSCLLVMLTVCDYAKYQNKSTTCEQAQGVLHYVIFWSVDSRSACGPKVPATHESPLASIYKITIVV